jgi:hypothetical protein
MSDADLMKRIPIALMNAVSRVLMYICKWNVQKNAVESAVRATECLFAIRLPINALYHRIAQN